MRAGTIREVERITCIAGENGIGLELKLRRREKTKELITKGRGRRTGSEKLRVKYRGEQGGTSWTRGTRSCGRARDTRDKALLPREGFVLKRRVKEEEKHEARIGEGQTQLRLSGIQFGNSTGDKILIL